MTSFPATRFAMLGVGLVLATSGCTLLSGGDPTPTEQFEQYVEQAGSNEVTGIRAARINGSWLLTVTIQPAGQAPQVWNQSGATADQNEVPRPSRAMSSQDFEALQASLAAEMPADCDGRAEWQLAPSGAALTWVYCSGADGGNEQYVPGSAKINGQPVRDQFDDSEAASWTAAAEIFGQVFVDGKVLELSAGDHAVGGDLIGSGAPGTVSDGTSCAPTLVLPGGEPENPLLLTCSGPVDPSSQLFELDSFDPALLASVRTQSAQQAGIQPTEVNGIKYTSPDGVNLEFWMWYGGTGSISGTISPG